VDEVTARTTYLDGLKDAANYLDTFRRHAEVDARVDRAWVLGYNLIAKMIDRHSCTDCPDSGLIEDARGRNVECKHPKLADRWVSS
jgi:hypothetical protein